MTLTGKWVKDQAGDLVMKWTGDEIPVMKPEMRKRAKGIHVRLTTNSAPSAWPSARCSGMAHTQVTKKAAELDWQKGNKVSASLRGKAGRSLAARLAALLPGPSCPFVTQSELSDLVKTDRSDIERQVRQAETMMRHPQRGMPATPYLLIHDWRRFLCWIDGVIQHLEQPRPVPELEHLIRTWQDRRADVAAPNLRWRRRADVIAV